MFKVEVHDNSYEYFSNINLSEDALHITSNLSLSKLIKESNKDNANKRKVMNIEYLLEDIYPKLNDSLNRNKLKVELRNILIDSKVDNTFLQEDNLNILFRDCIFLIESGIRNIPDIEDTEDKQETLKLIFNKFVQSNTIKEVINEISSLSNLKLKSTSKYNKNIKTIYLYNFNNLSLSRMIFFTRLKYIGYELIFRIPYMDIKTIDEPWINLYSREYFDWDLTGYKKFEDNKRNAFIDYLDGRLIEDFDTNIEFKHFIGSYEFKKELESTRNKKISYYALDTNLINQVFDIDSYKEYHTPTVGFMSKIYNCVY